MDIFTAVLDHKIVFVGLSENTSLSPEFGAYDQLQVGQPLKCLFPFQQNV
jgi:hypothetical protein